MTNDEILQAAKEAGFVPDWAIENCHQQFYRFATIIEKRTIEKCAVALDKVMVTDHSLNTFKRCQAAIRKLGEQ